MTTKLKRAGYRSRYRLRRQIVELVFGQVKQGDVPGHGVARTARPMTAAFNGAPSASFTVFGATPQRDAAILGLSAKTNIGDTAQLYLRYDAELASGFNNHNLTAGLRLSW